MKWHGLDMGYLYPNTSMSWIFYKTRGKWLANHLAFQLTLITNLVKLRERKTDKKAYQRLVDKLIYLFNTRLDIAYTVSVVNQFMYEPKELHLQVGSTESYITSRVL